MAKDTLVDAFLDALRDVYSAERQVAKSLPKLAKAATGLRLRTLFKTHRAKTKGQIDRLEQMFSVLKKKKKSHTCDGMAGILREAHDATTEKVDDRAMDSWLIASAQRFEHYEIAAYGTLIAWGTVLGYAEVVRLLKRTLAEEKAAAGRFSALAERGVIRRAAVLAKKPGEA